MLAVVVGGLVVTIGVTLWLGMFGWAAVAFCVIAPTVSYGYRHVADGPSLRIAVSIMALGAMAFVPTGFTQLEVMDGVVNMRTLKPAAAYPFVTGLRLIPQFVLIFGCWVVLGLRNDVGFPERPVVSVSYTYFGIAFQLAAVVGVVAGFHNHRIWQARLPGRGLILICYLVVFAINLWLWLSARRFFRRDTISGYSALFAKCAVAYIVLAVPAVLIGREYNQINRHYLDKRRPDAYVVANPGAVKDFMARNKSGLGGEVGRDLESLLNDREFEHVLRTRKFYKQNFDEPFQVFERAVMYGYKIDPGSPRGRPTFVTIRFPEELALALRFQFVGEDE